MTNMCFRILKAGCKVTLHRKELIDLANSICTIQSAVSSRLSAVKGVNTISSEVQSTTDFIFYSNVQATELGCQDSSIELCI